MLHNRFHLYSNTHSSVSRVWQRLTVLALGIVCVLTLPLAWSTPLEPVIKDGILDQQRLNYSAAVEAFDNNDLRRYHTLKKTLSDYPLYPYLEYKELKQALKDYRAHKQQHNQSPTNNRYSNQKHPWKQIDAFLARHAGSYLAKNLRIRTLEYLASAEKWRDYKQYYRADVKKTHLQCFYLQSKIKTGDIFPSAEIAKLWVHHKSQPKQCDPIFAAWKNKGFLSDDLLWERFTRATNKKNPSLATYVAKKMTSEARYFSTLYKDIFNTPSNINTLTRIPNKQTNTKDPSIQKTHDIIYTGLYRYAYSSPVEASQLLNQFSVSSNISPEKLTALQIRVAKNLVRQNELSRAMIAINAIDREQREDLVERLLRKLLEDQQWQDVGRWLPELPKEQLSTDRWQYWQARAYEMLNKPRAAQKIYLTLSVSRSFYGFLAADKQKTAYSLEDKPAPVDMTRINTIRQLPSMRRAKEFFLLGKMHRARVEWSYGIKGFVTGDYIAAGQLAHLWGWNRKAIEAMAGAKYWDDLTIRFPIVHKNIVEAKAQKNNIPSSLIFSIARQESAWEFDARSRVGARGLMQIMPATAKETAKKADMPYSKKRLFDPTYNIALGSHYITDLLEDYEQNRALAIASYNAGPRRVKQWLARTNASLPLDIWIEIIPFKETRKYVQNVLSYEVIYNYRQGQSVPLLTLAETKTAL